MATQVTRYIANDGREFKTEKEADNHNQAVQILRDIRPGKEPELSFYTFVITALERGWKFTKD